MATNPRYPVYVISKGRWQYERRKTHRALTEIGVPHKVVVEDGEYDNYAREIGEEHLLCLSTNFREQPDGSILEGSVPARNWVWEHSLENGHKKHWILDDNIGAFRRMNSNKRVKVTTGITFWLVEEFTDRFTNVKLSGMNYTSFVPSIIFKPPYILNTRIYSIILIDNSIEHRWRGKYNEDTDLSLRVLKDGWCTILFNTYVCDKATTHTVKGGNTDTVYKVGQKDFDNRYEFAKSLYEQHPDVVKITQKYGRWHHHVNYTRFKQELILRPDYEYKTGVNEFGMKMVRVMEDGTYVHVEE